MSEVSEILNDTPGLGDDGYQADPEKQQDDSTVQAIKEMEIASQKSAIQKASRALETFKGFIKHHDKSLKEKLEIEAQRKEIQRYIYYVVRKRKNE
jgi:vacuolar-type H+-ATPase subunit I/STV1